MEKMSCWSKELAMSHSGLFIGNIGYISGSKAIYWLSMISAKTVFSIYKNEVLLSIDQSANVAIQHTYNTKFQQEV